MASNKKTFQATLSESQQASVWETTTRTIAETERASIVNTRAIEKSIEYAKRRAYEMMLIRESIFDPDGNIKDEFLHTMMLQVGADSSNYILLKTVAFNGLYKNITLVKQANDDYKLTIGADTLLHYVYEKVGTTDSKWTISSFVHTIPASLNNKILYLSISCPKTGTASGTWIVSEEPIKVNQFDDQNLFIFNYGIIGVLENGERRIIETRGSSYILGDNIVTGKISSQDGSTYFDLINNIIAGDIRFISNGGTLKELSTWANEVENSIVDTHIEVEYSANAQTWSTTFADGMIWMRQKIGAGEWSIPMRIIGEDGIDGEKTVFYFAKNTSTINPPSYTLPLDTSVWTDGPPSTVKGEYLWLIKGVITPPSTNAVFLAPVRISGIDGTNAVSVGSVVGQYIEWLRTETTPPPQGEDWQEIAPTPNDTIYIWFRTKTTLTNGAISYSEPVNISGKDGANGKGISSVKEQYYLSTSKTTQTDGEWLNAAPEWVFGKYIWTKLIITYSDGSTSETTAKVNTEWEVVNELKTNTTNLLDNSNFRESETPMVFQPKYWNKSSSDLAISQLVKGREPSGQGINVTSTTTGLQGVKTQTLVVGNTYDKVISFWIRVNRGSSPAGTILFAGTTSTFETQLGKWVLIKKTITPTSSNNVSFQIRFSSQVDFELGQLTIDEKAIYTTWSKVWTTDPMIITPKVFGLPREATYGLRVLTTGTGGVWYRWIFEPGDYILTFWARSESNVQMHVGYEAVGVQNIAITTDWEKYVLRFNVTAGTLANNGNLVFYFLSAGTHYLTNIKLSVGNVDTGWSDSISIEKSIDASLRSQAITDKFSGIQGGLFTSVRLELHEAEPNEGAPMPATTAGISGQQVLNGEYLPAIWSGGTYEEALLAAAKAIIYHNGVIRAGGQGIHTILDEFGMRVFNEAGKMNIRFGMKNGYAVLEYYDNNGNFLYDLGPGGITYIDVVEEKWVTVSDLVYVDSTITSALTTPSSMLKYKNSGSQATTTYYLYVSKMVGGVKQDTINDGKYFVSPSKMDNKIPNGIYCRKAENNMQLITTKTSNAITPSDIHPSNEVVYDRHPLYRIQLYSSTSGAMTSSNVAYWNGDPI